jgi:transcriptional regulator with XRE-family HTH domain
MERLRAIRKALGYTVQQCADGVGVSHAKWTRWEALASDPNRHERHKIADFLGVTLDQLAGRAPYDAAQAA